MFIWVNQGIVEPYIPKSKEMLITKVNPPSPTTPEKPIEVHPDYTSEKEHSHFHFKTKSSYLEEENKDVKKQIFYAKDIMSKNVISVKPEASLDEVINLFSKSKFRHLAVTNPDNTLFGIVSERDILKFTIERLKNNDTRSVVVRDITKKKTLTAFPMTPIRDLAKIMFEERVGSVPILGKENYKLFGIVTRSDILKAVMNFSVVELYG